MRTRRRKPGSVKPRSGQAKAASKAALKPDKSIKHEPIHHATASSVVPQEPFPSRLEDKLDPPKSPDRPMLQRATSTTASDHQGTTRGPSEETQARFDCEQQPVSFGPWPAKTKSEVLDNNCSGQEGGLDPGRQSISLWDAGAAPLSLTTPGFGLIDPRNSFPEGRVVGVYFDKQRRIWRANWREGGVGKRKTKNFSVDDYGFEEARRLAIEYRLLKIMEASDKQLGGNGMAANEQAALLHAELKRKTEKKDSDQQKGKRRRRYTMSNNQLAKRSYLPGEFFRPSDAVYPHHHTPWGVMEDQAPHMLRAQYWDGYGYGYPPECVAPPPPMWMGLEDMDILEGTAANSSKVVTARPVVEGDSSAENNFPSSSGSSSQPPPQPDAQHWTRGGAFGGLVWPMQQ